MQKDAERSRLRRWLDEWVILVTKITKKNESFQSNTSASAVFTKFF